MNSRLQRMVDAESLVGTRSTNGALRGVSVRADEYNDTWLLECTAVNSQTKYTINGWRHDGDDFVCIYAECSQEDIAGGGLCVLFDTKKQTVFEAFEQLSKHVAALDTPYPIPMLTSSADLDVLHTKLWALQPPPTYTIVNELDTDRLMTKLYRQDTNICSGRICVGQNTIVCSGSICVGEEPAWRIKGNIAYSLWFITLVQSWMRGE